MPQQLQHDQFDARMDFAATANQSLYARFSYKDSKPRVVDGNLPAEAVGYRVQKREARQVAISDTWTLTPRLINELKLGFARNFNAARGELLGQELVDLVGIQGLQPAPGVENVPTVSIVGFTTVAPLAKQAPAENTYQFVDQVHLYSRKTRF